jgi:hypothetical protein
MLAEPGGTATTHADGFVALDDVSVEAPGPGQPFFEVAAPLLERGLRERLRVALPVVLQHAAVALSTAWGIQLSFDDVSVGNIEVGETATRLDLDARALVR